jgi:NitT/TauT family transport system ATP-binding protein
MDEPFAALDEITRFKLNDDLLRLKHELDCTIVFVTHSVYESVYLSDRIAVMTPRPGHVVATLAIDAPRERGMNYRSSAAYANRCGQVSDVLARAMTMTRASA